MNKFKGFDKKVRSTIEAKLKVSTKWEKYKKLRQRLSSMFEEFTGHSACNLYSFNNFVAWLHAPRDAASLGIFRILFGISMLIDIPEERGGGNLDLRFGEPKHCHFPLFNFIGPLGFPQMGVVYLLMWLGALGIALGYKFKTSCLMFVFPYFYIFLLDKPTWNNHSYLYGLCGLLLSTTGANKFCSVDYWGAPRSEQKIPFWNYFVLKFQFFILYFIAGLKKLTIEWLSGYAMTNLGYHWLFAPFRTILSVEMTELLVIHWCSAVFDFTITFWMTYEKTRLLALPFMLSFHLMNSRLFFIGMFPWVCLAELTLFFRDDWPRNIYIKFYSNKYNEQRQANIQLHRPQMEQNVIREDQQLRRRNKKVRWDTCKKEIITEKKLKPNWIKKMRVFLIIVYCFIQFFLPYSHFITKGYNNWTNGMYGYSWDMMVHSYDTILVSIKVVDNPKGEVHYLNPDAFSEYDRWTKHGDMAKQYADCIYKNLMDDFENNPRSLLTSRNLSIYFDVWCSMNGRFQQRVFDPRVDILRADWFPFEETKWVMSLLSELNHMRPMLNKITKDVLAWNNHSDVMFIADFPGLTMENYISSDLDNVTLTVLQGKIQYYSKEPGMLPISLEVGHHITVNPGEFHNITTIADKPSCYMYTYMNKTMKTLKLEPLTLEYNKAMLPVWKEFKERVQNYNNFLYHIGNSLMFLVYGVPIPVRIRERD